MKSRKFVCVGFRLRSHMISYFLSEVAEMIFAFYQIFIMVCWCKRYTNGMKDFCVRSLPRENISVKGIFLMFLVKQLRQYHSEVHNNLWTNDQKQPFSDVQNRCSYRKTPVFESLFNKNAGLQAINKDSNTNAFLWILRYLKEQLFSPPVDAFEMMHFRSSLPDVFYDKSVL